MTAAGLSLNKFCYAGLITAYKNKTPVSVETFMKVLAEDMCCCSVYKLLSFFMY